MASTAFPRTHPASHHKVSVHLYHVVALRSLAKQYPIIIMKKHATLRSHIYFSTASTSEPAQFKLLSCRTAKVLFFSCYQISTLYLPATTRLAHNIVPTSLVRYIAIGESTCTQYTKQSVAKIDAREERGWHKRDMRSYSFTMSTKPKYMIL